jgi:hypothetical protein
LTSGSLKHVGRVRGWSCALSRLGCGALLLPLGCASLPRESSERSLYMDLRKMVEANEDGGWTVDRLRMQAVAEPALRSVCQVEPKTRAALDLWLVDQIARAGGPSERAYFAHGKNLSLAAEALSLERTRALLHYADSHAQSDCPYWLTPTPGFNGEQGDVRRWVLLGETQAFGTITVPEAVPALGGGGRIFLGHGVGRQLTLALGADVAASGTFIPSSGSGRGIDAYVTLAAPAMLRLMRFSRFVDLELAPVVRFAPGQPAWPPGGRVEVGVGFASVRTSPLMPYFTFYAGYEVHPANTASGVDHTIELGTRLAVDWAP